MQLEDPQSLLPLIVEELKQLSDPRYSFREHDKTIMDNLLQLVKRHDPHANLRISIVKKQQLSNLPKRKSCVRPILLKASACVVAAIVTALIAKTVYARPKCTELTLDIVKEQGNYQEALNQLALREKQYAARAQLNCKSEMMRAQQQEGVPVFCNTGYLIKNIPHVWHLPSGSPADKVCLLPTQPRLDMPQVYLTCYAREVLKASLYAKDIQKRLDGQKAQQALFCG